MATRKGNRWVVWIMVALIALGFGGWFTGGVGGRTTSLGTVGGLDLPIQSYVNGIQSQMRSISEQTGQPLTFAQAQALGIDRAVLAQVVTERVLDAEAERLGLSVGDERVAEQILVIPAFQGLDGQFDRTAYREALRRNGLTEEVFEEGLREQQARSILQAAVTGGVPPATTYGEVLSTYSNERRTVTWARLGTDAIAVAPQPTEEDLRAFYEANPDRFTTPETRTISYAWITPEMIQDHMPVEDADLRALYDERIDEFVQEERRLVERLVYPSAEAAEAARARIDSGEATFEQLVEERGLLLSDTDLGDVDQSELGAAAEAVFAAETGSVVGPIETELGPALFRVNAVLAADETPFEEAAPQLRAELAGEAARDAIAEMRPQVEDLLAGGAGIEDIAERTDLEAGQIAWADGVTEGPAAYDPFRDAAAALEEGDEPQLVELGDGGLAVLRLDGIAPPVLRPFEDVEAELRKAWEAQALQETVTARAASAAEAIAAGAGFEEQGLTPEVAEGLTRRDAVEGTSADFIETIFTLEPGQAVAIPAEDGTLVVRLDAVEEADPEDEAIASESTAIAAQVAQSIAQDLFDAYARQLQAGTEIRIDDATVAAVNAQIN